MPINRRRHLKTRANIWVLRTIDRLRGLIVSNTGWSHAYIPHGNRIEKKTRFTENNETILLLQGFFHTRGVLNVMEDRLRRDGFSVFSINIAGFLNIYNTKPIEVLAEKIAYKVETLRRKHELGRISIIAHSMGGLVSRYYIQALKGDNHVKSLITLGTPHHGTPTAWVAAVPPLSMITRCGIQMLPQSPFIKDLTNRAVPPTVKLVSICSKEDVVCPYRYSLLEARANETIRNFCVDGIGHTSLLYSDRVYRLIKKELVDSIDDNY